MMVEFRLINRECEPVKDARKVLTKSATHLSSNTVLRWISVWLTEAPWEIFNFLASVIGFHPLSVVLTGANNW